MTPREPVLCPSCEARLDNGVTTTHRVRRTSPGDVSVCIFCLAVVIFDAMLKPRSPYAGELEAAYLTSPNLCQQVERAQAAARTLGYVKGQRPRQS